MSSQLVVFSAMSIVAVLSAVGVIVSRNAVRAALALVVNFIVLGVLYFTMSLELLGISQVLVYTGLIMMLFLFCILLLNLGAPQMLEETSGLKRYVAVLLSLVLIVLVLTQVLGPVAISGAPGSESALAGIPTAPDGYGTAKSVGTEIFTNWIYALEICSVLLLLGIVGSILLAKRRG